MGLTSLDNLVRGGQLKAEAPAQSELDGLIRSGLDAAHRKRNFVEYEGVVDVDEQLVAALIRVTREVAARVRKLPPVQEG
jgi:hypothetical protein